MQFPIILLGTTCATVVQAIINGRNATILDNPSIASIMYDGRICGGTVIQPQVILTSASCVDRTLEGGSYNVRVGSSSTAEGGQILPISRIIQHAQWDSNKFRNNIAFLFTKTNMTEIDGVKAASLPTERANLLSGLNVRPFGWGSTSVGPSVEDDRPSLQLQEVDMISQSRRNCREQYLFDITIPDSAICFEPSTVDDLLDAPPSICEGDPGGPLMEIGLQNNLMVRGILSFYGSQVANEASMCSSTPYANVAEDLSYHKDYITSIVAQTTS